MSNTQLVAAYILICLWVAYHRGGSGSVPGDVRLGLSLLRRSSTFIRSAMQSHYAVGVCQPCLLKKKIIKKNMHSTHRMVITIVKPKVQQ